MTATCKTKRKGDPVEVTRSFSIEDAKAAGLLSQNKPTWKLYPRRMLQMRARSWALRDKYADLLKGLQVREEVDDYIDTTVAPVEEMPLRKSEIAAGPVGQVQVTPTTVCISEQERKELSELAIDKGITPDVMKGWIKRYGGVEPIVTGKQIGRAHV